MRAPQGARKRILGGARQEEHFFFSPSNLAKMVELARQGVHAQKIVTDRGARSKRFGDHCFKSPDLLGAFSPSILVTE